MRQMPGSGLFESAQGLHQPDEGQHIHQQRQGQAQLTAVGQEADAGADRGQRQHNKTLIQVELLQTHRAAIFVQAGMRMSTFR